MFSNYTKISLYLQSKYGISANDVAAIGESSLFYSPQVNISFLICLI
jgi:hypothetical protein